MTSFLPVVVAVASPVLVSTVLILLFRLTVERIRPMAAPRRDRGALNVLSCVVWTAANHAFAPVVSVTLVLLINHLGGGWITLPNQGAGLILGFIVYALALDLAE